MTQSIAGYSHGAPDLARSPITLAAFEQMKKSALFADEDLRALKQSYQVLEGQTEAILDVWYGFVGANDHLLASFKDKTTGQPIGPYLERVRARFARWILDTARAEYDQQWLDYQHEIGLRHHRAKKNQTDGVNGANIVPFRDLFALIFPITFTLRPFLAKGGHSAEQVEAMYNAWLKSCLLQLTLWSQPYVKEGDF